MARLAVPRTMARLAVAQLFGAAAAAAAVQGANASKQPKTPHILFLLADGAYRAAAFHHVLCGPHSPRGSLHAACRRVCDDGTVPSGNQRLRLERYWIPREPLGCRLPQHREPERRADHQRSGWHDAHADAGPACARGPQARRLLRAAALLADEEHDHDRPVCLAHRHRA